MWHQAAVAYLQVYYRFCLVDLRNKRKTSVGIVNVIFFGVELNSLYPI
jgi:hypothetical protein